MFLSNFMQKRQILVPEPHFEEVRGDARPWLMALWKAHVDFLFSLVKFFAIYYSSGVMRRNVYNSAVFAGCRPLALKFYLDEVARTNHFWHQITRGTGLPEDENCIPLRSLTIPECDGQTDGQADGRTDLP